MLRTLLALSLLGLGVISCGSYGLMFGKAEPDYDKLERNRKAQKSRGAPRSVGESNEPYWTGFRGPNRDGHYDEMPVGLEWPEQGPKPLWHQPGGGGYGSFAVAHHLAITLEQRRLEEVVVAYDLDTGTEVWTTGYPALFEDSLGGDGPRSTPYYRDGKIFSLGATGELLCLNVTDGTIRWRTNVLRDTHAENLEYGLSSSPFIIGKRLYVTSGIPEATGAVAAYDVDTGELEWKALEDHGAYMSPMMIEVEGHRQLVVGLASRIVGLDPVLGTELWDFPFRVMQGLSISQPVEIGSGRIMISAGYGKGAAAFEIVRLGDTYRAQPLWQSRFLKNKFNASIYHEGNIYGLSEGVLTCIDAEDGKRLWRGPNFGFGQMIMVDDRLLIQGGEGEVVVVQVSPEGFEETSRFQIWEENSWTVPALAHGRLLIRNAQEMACFDLRLKG